MRHPLVASLGVVGLLFAAATPSVVAAAPGVSFSANTLDFGSAVWEHSVTQTLVVTNTGDAPLSVQTIDISGEPYVPADFMVFQDTCTFTNQTIAPGAQCQIYIRFTPQAGGPRTRTLSLYDNAPGSPHQITLTGRGTGAVVRFFPRFLDFGTVAAGTTSPPLSFTTVNAGDAAVNITSAALGPAPGNSTWFALTQDGCTGATLGPGQRCTISATVAPTAVGGGTQFVNFTDDAGTGRQIYGEGVTGLNAGGGGPLLSILNPPPFLNQGVGTTSAPLSLQVFNAGTQPLQIMSVALDSSTSGFAIAHDGCSGVTLPVNAPFSSPPTCNVDLTFAPTAQGSSSVHVVFQDNELAGSHSQLMSGNGYAPVASLSTGAVDFGFQPVGVTSAAQTVTVANPSPLPLNVGSVTLGGANPAAFRIAGNTCTGATVAPNGSCSVGVTFNPFFGNLFTATLSIASNAATSPPVPQTVPLHGEGTVPAFSISSSDLNFGSLKAGVASAPQTITVTNTSSTADGFGFLTAAGVKPVGCTGSIAPGATCTVTVTVTPGSLGLGSGLLKVVDNAFNQQVVQVDWVGNTGAVFIEGPLSFGQITQQVGTSVATSGVIRNGGGASLNIGQITLTGTPPAAITTDGCSNQSIAPGDHCNLTLTTTPAVVGGWFTNLTVPTDAIPTGVGTNPTTLFIRGLAGPAAQPTFLPSSVSFPDQRVGAPESTQVVWLDNGLVPAGGTQALAVASVALGGPDAGAFRVVWDGCSGLSLEGAFSCPVEVGFDPTAGRAFSASLLYNDNAAGTPHAVPLNGVGLAPEASPSAQQLAFAVLPAGQQSQPQTLTLTNTGNLPLNVSSVTAGAPFVLSGDTCSGSAVAPGASCAAIVVFAPATRGVFNMPLVITDDAPDSPQQVALTGQSVVRQLSISPASLDFGRQPVGPGDVSSQQLVTITNTGPDPVTLSGFAVSAGFAIGTQTCAAGVLAPSASCQIGVYAAPAAVGTETGALTISDDATGAPHMVALTAVGLGGLATPSTSSVDFGSVRVGTKSAPVTITLTNTGNVSVSISRVVLSGPNKGEYTIVSQNCQNQMLAPGSSCQVVIVLRPEATGTRSATLTFTDLALNSPQTVSLTGTGVSK